ncbi:MAG: BamA/TamA family outer membrane protein [Myxococcota bacterium]
MSPRRVLIALLFAAWPGLGRAQLDPFDQALVQPDQIIESVDIRGNGRTQEGVIRRRILLAEGDLVDDRLVQASRLRLLGTGFFSEVDFSLERGSRRGRVILVVTVEERNTVVVDRLYLGTSPVSRLFGGLGVADGNFLGRGVTLGGTFALGEDRQAVEARTFLPSLADTALQLSASFIFVRGAELLDASQEDGFQLRYRRVGGTFGLGIGVGPAQRVSVIYRLESVNADRLPNLDPPVLRQAPSIQFDESVISTVRLGYERDTRNDPFVPTSGDQLAFGIELGTSLLGSDYEFSKYTGSGALALEPFPAHSLVFRAEAGLIQGQAAFFDQFFIGDHTYFAFGRDSLPRAVQLNFSEANDYDDLLLGGGVEYALPLYQGRSGIYRIYLYAGVEAVVTASLDEVQEDPSGRSTGGLFPMSFDLGLKMDTLLGAFTLSSAYIAELFL